jgi:hypothetical protein
LHGVTALRRWFAQARGEGASDTVPRHDLREERPQSARVIECGLIFPSFPEREIEFRNGWSADFELDVVPGRAATETRVQFDDLMIAAVVGIVSTTMTEVDSPHECHVTFERSGMSNEDHLLVVRSASAHSLVEQSLATRQSHVDGETSILLRTEREAVAVRTPEQPSNVNSFST